MESDSQMSLAILFANICNKTLIFNRKGNKPGQALISDCHDIMRDRLLNAGGFVLRSTSGDILAVLATPDDACRAACAMQEGLTSSPMSVKVGFHYGAAIPYEGDIYGDAVNLAARLAALAAPGEIMTTGMTADMMSPIFRRHLRHVTTATLKGKQRSTDIHEVIWNTDGLTIDSTAFDEVINSRSVILRLKHKDILYQVDVHHPRLSIGRDKGNDLVWPLEVASRRHAIIEIKHGRSVLTDLSSNGTYVAIRKQAPIRLKRDSTNLFLSGSIGLNSHLEESDETTIYFECQIDPAPGGQRQPLDVPL